MFTGLVETVGELVECKAISGGVRIRISSPLAEELTPPTLDTRIANREGPWCSSTPRPWGELNIQIRSGGQPLGVLRLLLDDQHKSGSTHGDCEIIGE